MPIRILAPEVASQIAAGEVVERPASVVKELVENALDAGASFIQIGVEEAGKRLIEVADDGSGIPEAELPLAMERHATSKLSVASDLFHINTLGFRGEALVSIGSVSRLTIISRPPDSSSGALMHVEAGIAKPVEMIGVPVGTVVRIEDLFYNTPARLKFLKSDTTERRHINRLVTHYALAYPKVRFQLTQDNRPALNTSGNGDQREVLVEMYGADVARQMLEVVYDDTKIDVQGFISPISLTRSNRREITFFVNGRPVKDAALSAAIIKGYHTLLMVGRYPLAVLFIQINPSNLDVNVHPTKAEVRFEQPSQVFTGVQGAVRRALLAYNPVPNMGNEVLWSSNHTHGSIPQQIDPAWGMLGKESQSGNQLPRFGITHDESPETNATSLQANLPVEGVPLLRPIGQIANAYLVAEGPDGLYLIDQHAAHERVLFERFMAQRNEEIPSQSLLQPVTVELSPDSSRIITKELPLLSKLGFQVEAFGRNTFLNEARMIARICKRAAVKAGMTLSPEEQRALLQDLEACLSPRTCPHGRPTMIHLSVDLLERQFGRKGAR